MFPSEIAHSYTFLDKNLDPDLTIQFSIRRFPIVLLTNVILFPHTFPALAKVGAQAGLDRGLKSNRVNAI